MKNLLIIGFTWPEPNSTAAGSRMLQLIELFKKENYNITFASTASKNINSFNFSSLNIKTIDIELNNSSFDVILKEINPVVVLFDRYLTEEQFGWRIEENCPKALRILDTEDLHFLRYARHTAYRKNTEVSLKLLTNDIAKREIASIYRCDLTLIISKFEMELLTKTFKINKSLLIYVPFLLNSVNTKLFNSYPSFDQRKNFISIGNFKHEPNWNAVLYLKQIIWPLIHKELPNVEMHIYGAYTSEKVKQLHNKQEGFFIKGWAKDTETVFKNSRVCLAPLQFGAGLKGKLIDSMLYGTPNVTSQIGAEGMQDKLPWNGFIEDDPTLFAKKAIKLYLDENIWEVVQQNGVNIIDTCFSKEIFTKKLMKRIQKIAEKLIVHRENNFVGSMLLHHKLKSTKYLSKWIEEKNKPD